MKYFLSEYRGRNRCHRHIAILHRPCHVKEEDKNILDKEMNRLCYFGTLKGFSSYSSPVMLVSRKVTKGNKS